MEENRRWNARPSLVLTPDELLGRRRAGQSEFARLAARPADGAGPDLEIIARAAERAHRQPLGIPAICVAAGSLGTSKMTETFRDPHIGHFNRASKLVIWKALPSSRSACAGPARPFRDNRARSAWLAAPVARPKYSGWKGEVSREISGDSSPSSAPEAF
jgi:hypothetical protein